MLLRAARRRGVRPADSPSRAAARRRRVPGDVPPCAPRLSLTPPRRGTSAPGC
jgi:hypothetical protein